MKALENYLFSSEAARFLNVSKDRVHQLADRGKLKAVRTSGGVRLFDPLDVEKLALKRGKNNEESKRPVRRDEKVLIGK